MSDDTAIKVENLSKRYRIGLREARHETLAGALTDTIVSPIRNLRRLRRLTTFDDGRHADDGRKATDDRSSSIVRGPASGEALSDIIWALRDVSFEVQRGEVVGIIGRNGAGKSTLLKILSRITEPTSGRVELNGRVSSLLEVGTGFHPELTGRDNVYLNGAILGMTKAEIDQKFDEIVDFSGVEQFIDTPVKRYSSGMRVRLAFSVAAHLEPEILLVDEVLAVGDTAFQEKCIGKMQDVAHAGRTVLFVSHNMASIQSLCSRGLLIDNGRLTYNGQVTSAISVYLDNLERKADNGELEFREDRQGGELFRFTRADFVDPETERSLGKLMSGRRTLVKLHYVCKANKMLENVTVSVAFYTTNKVLLFACRSDAIGYSFSIAPGESYLLCEFPKLPLKAGRYAFNVLARQKETTLDWIKTAGLIDVEAGDYYDTGILPAMGRPGVLVDYSWHAAPERTYG